MKISLQSKPAYTAVLLSAACALFGTASGAQAPANLGSGTLKSPEIEGADQRVEQAKAKLDQAHKQLNAAKALVKAAEAEFRATKADREALALRVAAQQLAEASAQPPTTVDPVRNIIVPQSGSRLTPATQPALAPVPQTVTPVPATPAAIQPAKPAASQALKAEQLDFNAQPNPDDAAQPGAPLPKGELKPAPTAEPQEPNSVP